MLPEIEIGEVEAWREEHSLVEHGRPGDGFFFDDEICRLHHSEDSLVDCVALSVKQRQALAPDLHCSRINKLVWLFSISSFLFFSLRSYMDLTELSLNFSFILIEAVLHDYKWMLKLDVEARAERALLQLWEDLCIQYRPIWVQCQRVKLFEVFFVVVIFARWSNSSYTGAVSCHLSCLFGENDQLFEGSVRLATAFEVRIRVGKSTQDLKVKVLVQSIQILLHIV